MAKILRCEQCKRSVLTNLQLCRILIDTVKHDITIRPGDWITVKYHEHKRKAVDEEFAYVCAIRSKRMGERVQTYLCVSWAYPISAVAKRDDKIRNLITKKKLNDDDLVVSNHFDLVPRSSVTSWVYESNDTNRHGVVEKVTDVVLDEDDDECEVHLCSSLVLQFGNGPDGDPKELLV